MKGSFEISYETVFQASHGLRFYQGGTEPEHSHDWKIIFVVEGDEPDKAGVAFDFIELKKAVDEETKNLTGKFLNDEVEEFQLTGDGEENNVGGLSPSAENVAVVLYQRIIKKLPAETKVKYIQVYEEPGCSAIYRPVN